MIYAYAHLSVKNPEALAQYRDVADAALAKHGGRVVTAARDFDVLDGAPQAPGRPEKLIALSGVS